MNLKTYYLVIAYHDFEACKGIVKKYLSLNKSVKDFIRYRLVDGHYNLTEKGIELADSLFGKDHESYLQQILYAETTNDFLKTKQGVISTKPVTSVEDTEILNSLLTLIHTPQDIDRLRGTLPTIKTTINLAPAPKSNKEHMDYLLAQLLYTAQKSNPKLHPLDLYDLQANLILFTNSKLQKFKNLKDFEAKLYMHYDTLLQTKAARGFQIGN